MQLILQSLDPLLLVLCDLFKFRQLVDARGVQLLIFAILELLSLSNIFQGVNLLLHLYHCVCDGLNMVFKLLILAYDLIV